jgi:hypothetical protein
LRLLFVAIMCVCLHLKAEFIEIDSARQLQQLLALKKKCIVAVGLNPCIPCEIIKGKLVEDAKSLPDIYYIDLKKFPRIRHVFQFKAVPYLAIYNQGDQTVQLTGASSCSEYLENLKNL